MSNRLRQRTWFFAVWGVFAGAVPYFAGLARAQGEEPPAALFAKPVARGAALEPIFALFKLDRLKAEFSEEKRIALLARPLVSSGTIYFDRARGIARVTLRPRAEQMVLTATTLRLRKNQRTEEIPLDKSKDLRAFAMIFPTLLSGERVGLERAFDVGLHGATDDWWALVFTPKDASLGALIQRVVVVGRKQEVVSLQVIEASGDTTLTRFTAVRKNDDVPAIEIADAFGP